MSATARRRTGGDWHAQHLSVTGTSLTADDARLVVVVDRDRHVDRTTPVPRCVARVTMTCG